MITVMCLEEDSLQSPFEFSVDGRGLSTNADDPRPFTLDSLNQLPGLVVFGTFRSTGGKEALKRGLAFLQIILFQTSFTCRQCRE